MSKARRPSGEKGLPPLPAMTMMDALAANTRSIRINEDEQTGSLKDSLRSRGLAKSKRKMQGPTSQPSLSLSTDTTPPYSSLGSPATPTAASTATRGPFKPPSIDSTRSLATGYDPKNPFGPGTGAGHHTPHSPSSPSQHSQSTTPRSVTGFMLGTRSSSKSAAVSVRSSATVPEMTGYNDVDQWGSNRAPPPISPKREGLASSLGSGLRRKNSGGRLLVNGLSRSLTRMGSVVKRSTSDNNMNLSVSGKRKEWTKKRAATSRHSTVAEAEEMGEGWERVGMHKEITEGDTSITRPFNVAHDLHVSPDLGDLPPAWLEALKAQGLSEADLLLIAAARHRAAQRPLVQIGKGSTPSPDSNLINAGLNQNHHHSRGMSTPAYLVNADRQIRGEDKPLLNKRFSWEKAPSTPTGTSTPLPTTEEPISPFRAFRQSLADSPPKANAHVPVTTHADPESPLRRQSSHPYAHTSTRAESPDEMSYDGRASIAMDETPKKTKRWSDQLRGFQSSFSSFGGDDDWGSQLTLALTGESGLQTVHEVDSRGPSMDSRRSDPVDGDGDQDRRGEGTKESGDQSTPTGKSRNPKSLSIQPSTTPKSTPPGPPSTSRSPVSPRSSRSPGGTRTRRKPVPANLDTTQGQGDRRKISSPRRSIHSTLSDRSYPGSPPPPWRKEKSGTPRSEITPTESSRPPMQHATSFDSLGTPTKPTHFRSHSQSVTQQSTESEVEHDIRTPSTNHQFFHSPSSSLSHPTMPRSISEESQFTTTFDLSTMAHSEHMLAAFSFPGKIQPPRSNPRYSMPASAGYTESSPPTRGPTPSYAGESESEEPYHVHIPIAIPAGVVPTTSPRITKKISSRRNKIGCSPSAVLYAVDSPSNRDPAPSYEGSESEDAHPSNPVTHPNEAVLVPSLPTTPPRFNKTSSRRVKNGHSPSAQSLRHAVLDSDPINGWDQAHTIDERASIALSLLSGSCETDTDPDPRSSMTSSLRDSLKGAKVLKAYTRDLSGVDEGNSTSGSMSGSGSGSDSSVSARARARARVLTSARPEIPLSEKPINPEAMYDAESASQPIIKRSPPSTNISGDTSGSRSRSKASSRRQNQSSSTSPAKTPPQSRGSPHPHQQAQPRPHPFAYRKDSAATSQYSEDDDPLRALEDAAREIARRTGRYQSVSGGQRESGGHGTFSDADE